jgi:hypothetical protein
MLRRRRPLLRAAAVAGAGYIAGKKVSERDGDQQDGGPGPQAVDPAPADAPASGISDASIERLKRLAELRDQGVLTEEEFNAEKGKVLDGA